MLLQPVKELPFQHVLNQNQSRVVFAFSTVSPKHFLLSTVFPRVGCLVLQVEICLYRHSVAHAPDLHYSKNIFMLSQSTLLVISGLPSESLQGILMPYIPQFHGKSLYFTSSLELLQYNYISQEI